MDARTDDREAAAAALDLAREAGIHCLPIQTPFGIGDVNCYLIEDDPLTLVDCGPNTATSLLDLDRQLTAIGHGVQDIELLVVTHQHADHMGLAHVFAQRTNAEISCLDIYAPKLADWETHSAENDDDALLLMQRHGVEDHVADALRAVGDILHGYGASSRVDRPLAPGATIALAGRELVVHHRPGHSPSDIVLHDAERRILVAGDHLLAGISSNAVISRPLTPGWDGSRPHTLIEYRASLRATAEMDVDLVLGGHRDPVTDHRALVATRLAEHDRRAERFYDHLSAGPMTAHEIATATWGPVAITQVFLTLSEVLGHLDLLVADGRVREDRSEHVIRFERA
ncbi:MBL fold metallo-hydrolase [Paraconexibacter antarcticus]|uniref:MBL fold metallo-hydrolase n=1 Tax=Paraconexibacter antarcticus TaxID=2949664 RepID=A0ABY5DXJ2_9ACTN|nr:MBL fold metallo-hydrolase [Paraconexibacter antarcticus]UTI65397.1 MBL fold metallo-hydrolase [Paraconexibacter antarcticus]